MTDLSFVDHAAAGNLEEVQRCLFARPSEINIMLALAAAAGGGHRSVVQSVLLHIPRPSLRSQAYLTACSKAIASHSADILKDLLAHCPSPVRAQVVPRLAEEALKKKSSVIFKNLLDSDRPALKDFLQSERGLITAVQSDASADVLSTLLSHLPASVRCQKSTSAAIAREQMGHVRLLASRTDIPYVLAQVLSAHKDHNSSIKLGNPTTNTCIEFLVPHLSDVQFEALSKTLPPLTQVPAWSDRLKALNTQHVLAAAVHSTFNPSPPKPPSRKM